MKRDLINIRILSHRLRMPIAWLEQEATTNRIPAIKVGDEFFFNYHAVEKVLLKRAKESNTDE